MENAAAARAVMEKWEDELRSHDCSGFGLSPTFYFGTAFGTKLKSCQKAKK